MRLIDLSHEIFDGLVTYPGLPEARVQTWMSRESSRARYEPGTEFRISRIDMVGNTGTYVDVPSHRFEEGDDLTKLSLDRCANLPGVVIDARSAGRALQPTLLAGHDLDGVAVLFHTGWSRFFGTPAYGSGHPFLTRSMAVALVDRGATLVGIDSLNIDDTADSARPVHTALLGGGIAIVEHLTNLDALTADGFRFFAVPPRIRGLDSFPVRAFALLSA